MDELRCYCNNLTSVEPTTSVEDTVELLRKVIDYPDKYEYYIKDSFELRTPRKKYDKLMKFIKRCIKYLHKKYNSQPKQQIKFYYDVLELFDKEVHIISHKSTKDGRLLDQEWFLEFVKDVITKGRFINGGFYQNFLHKLLSSETYQVSGNIKEIIIEILKFHPALETYTYISNNINQGLVHHLIYKFDHVFLNNVLKYKNECDIDVNDIDSKGNTPLHIASKYSLKDAAEVLINHGADITKITHDGKSVIDLLQESNGTYRFPTWQKSDNTKLIKKIKEM